MVGEVADRRNSALAELNLNERHKEVLVRLPSGSEVRIEDGADGTWWIFDGDCLEMLPYCRAQCCALKGTIIFDEEIENLAKIYGEEAANKIISYSSELDEFVLKRDSDGRCTCLDRDSKLCSIYENRPNTCQQFHCSRGSGMRGWKMENVVRRQCSP